MYIQVFSGTHYIYITYCLPCITARACMANTIQYFFGHYFTLLTCTKWNQLIQLIPPVPGVELEKIRSQSIKCQMPTAIFYVLLLYFF